MGGFQKSSEFDNQPKNDSLEHTLTCHQGAFPFALREILNELSLSSSVTR